ncbi:hypothetical protein [Hydrocarboniclastica marina]|uniref:Uncharacterized protein n=1 Tax=Hydrocarboniclastica marina TaxID=2259620 RepID=A0A4P7XF53_9ALTE|nr:hypothetical protein [Hydrocarboniclastica marina]QCF25203.1 hypothetical protein soil367_04245 [Hydrocarboniclastica marina]
MSNNDPLNPTGKNTSNQPPLGDPAVPPNPSTRDAAQAAGKTSTTPASGSGSAQSKSPSGSTQSVGGNGQKEQLQQEMNQTGSKVKTEVTGAAREFADSARKTAEAQAQRQQDAAAGELGGIANALRKTADEVQGQSYFPLDRYARQAADKLDDLSESLRGGDVRTALSRLETYTREQPGVVLGGAIISGFLLARFIRASGERRHSSSSTGSTAGYSSNAARGNNVSRPGATVGSSGTGMYPGNGTPY